MKSLQETCIPRKEIIKGDTSLDVVDIMNVIDDSLNPGLFFDLNQKTQGMSVLLNTAFERFKGRSTRSIIKLTQSMGGGKTHNMISLGLLAKHPEFRQNVISKEYDDEGLGEIKVIAYTGRETDVPNGIWGEIAKQLGKEELFKDYWENGLKAPGQSAWINLLKGDPKLILLDELPPYLVDAKSKKIGDSNLSEVTSTALANLFNALNKRELSNILLVISDLKATYQLGTRILQASFKDLEGEVNRFAMEIEPVSSSSDEIYNILKKRLFIKLPDDETINEIALQYKNEVNNAKQMGYTNYSPDKIFTGIKDSYPFHPSLRELYERFKENQNFQQTRDLIRLMRKVVLDLYNTKKAENQFLINPFDLDLNDLEMHTTITQIKSSLSNAISHDIANKGRAVAETIDRENNDSIMQSIAKLILVSSLADVPNSLIGLNKSEIVGYLAAPERDFSNIKKSIDEFITLAWYLHTDKDGRLHFQHVRNLTAELNSLVDSYSDDQSKIQIRDFLKEKFKPTLRDCYQEVMVFPALDEIRLSEEKILLILFDPNIAGTGLHPSLKKLWDDTQFKNRVLFLSGERNTMDNLLNVAKEHKAIVSIIKRMKDERIREDDPQFQDAQDRETKIIMRFLSGARETFVKLYYPTSLKGDNIIADADFIMNFSNNEYKGEDQIRNVLIEKKKFIEKNEISSDTFKNKCEDRLFTQKQMRWQDIRSRAATYPAWQWHHLSVLDDLLEDCLIKGYWRKQGNYIEKPPFPAEDTTVTVQELNRDKESGKVVLKIIPKFGDIVYWEINQEPTEASSKVENFSDFRTDEMIIWFKCYDSQSEHKPGPAYKWINKLWVGYSEPYESGNNKMIQLKASNNAKILYTTNGSDPQEYGAIYDSDIVIPKNTKFILVYAEKAGVWSERLEIPINWTDDGVKLTKGKPINYSKTGRFKTSDSNNTFKELNLLKKHKSQLNGVSLHLEGIFNGNNTWISMSIDEKMNISPETLEKQIMSTKEIIFSDEEMIVGMVVDTIYFETGQNFEDWLSERKVALKDIKPNEIRQ